MPSATDRRAPRPTGWTPDQPVVALAGVCKRFGATEVLKGITASVEKGEVVCIIGPSGSGKSHHPALHQRARKPMTGAISGSRGGGRSRRGARSFRSAPKVGMVFQRFNLFPHRTALENVIEGADLCDEGAARGGEERGRALLARVGLAGKADVHPPQLSGGQQQRVALPARSPCSRRRCCSTSRPRRSIPNWSARCWSSCASWPTRA